MVKDIRKIIARGVCTFGARINRNRDGYGSIVASDSSEACAEICDFCWHMANHILTVIEEADHGKQQSTQEFSGADREA